MPRRGQIAKRDVLPDPLYNSKLVTRLINSIMLDGKKGVAQKIVYDAFDIIKEKTGNDPLETFEAAMENVMPVLEVKARRVGGATYQYQIIAGERRYRAAQMAGLETIPAYVRTVEDETLMEMALIENIQREDLNSIEIALAFQKLIELYQLTQEKLSERVGKKRTTIANYLRLLKLPAEVQIGLRDKRIDMGHARALLSVADPALQLELYERILSDGLSVRSVEDLAKTLSAGGERARKKAQKKVMMRQEYNVLKSHLSDFFNAKVQFTCDEKGKGKISIPFKNEEDLERIIGLFDKLK